MTIKASTIPSICSMSQANIAVKRDLRKVLETRFPELTNALNGLGDCPIISKSNKELTGQIQHVNLTGYHLDVQNAAALIAEAMNVLGNMHNEQTAHAESIGVEMEAPNGGGGR